eukprot:CAMPEP_0113662342 /NCGR_PEP_ID=MMETSP0038_2-20120614/516_1 /TAXON_ID=2898 /ORGANISM="Cryptomonas paramecium" /LENGTH=106 /DNA_ID=CAMNT_0000577213 /DNA_START=394 /DNA_END=711 /DNA_ORIENTATION=- /assembly_acc=CAM_ASM_000170
MDAFPAPSEHVRTREHRFSPKRLKNAVQRWFQHTVLGARSKAGARLGAAATDLAPTLRGSVLDHGLDLPVGEFSPSPFSVAYHDLHRNWTHPSLSSSPPPPSSPPF